MATYELLNMDKHDCLGPCSFCEAIDGLYYHVKNTEIPATGMFMGTKDCCEDCARSLGLVW